MSTSSTTDPILVCPEWCDLSEHDQVEQLRNLQHWRDMLTLEAKSARFSVDVVKDGHRAASAVRLELGELIEGSTTLTVEQAAQVIQAIQDAVDLVAEYATPSPNHRLEAMS